MEISPPERIKINQLVYKLGLEKVPSDTNIMAWVLPVMEGIVNRFEAQERRIRELEISFDHKSKDVATFINPR